MNHFKKGLSLLLSIAMLLSIVPLFSVTSSAGTYVNPYHNSSYAYTTGNLTYGSEKDSLERVEVFDISYCQGTVNWAMVKNAGIDYIIMRVGRRTYGSSSGNGTVGIDSKFTEYMTGAISAGIGHIGVYFYSLATTNAEVDEETNFIISKCAPYKNYINLPIYHDYEFPFDSEDSRSYFWHCWNTWGTMTKAKATTLSKRWCQNLKNAGYKTGVNCAASFFTNNIDASALYNDGNEIWVAYYTSNINRNSSFWHYKNPTQYNMWQYDMGDVPGMNYGYNAATTWVGVKYGSYSGYVHGDYLDFTGEQGKATTTSNLNLRSGKGTSYSAVTQIPSGATVTITSYPGYATDLDLRWIEPEPEPTPDPGPDPVLPTGTTTVTSNLNSTTYTIPISRGEDQTATAYKPVPVINVGDREQGAYTDTDSKIEWQFVNATGVKHTFICGGIRGYNSAARLLEDANFTDNITGAIAANMNIGIYYTSRAITVAEAEAEADNLISRLASYKSSINLPVFIEYDSFGNSSYRTQSAYTSGTLTKAIITNLCKAFCAKMKAAGYDAGVYSNAEYFTDRIDADAIYSAGYRIWVKNTNTNMASGSTWDVSNPDKFDMVKYSDSTASWCGINYPNSSTGRQAFWLKVEAVDEDSQTETGWIRADFLDFTSTRMQLNVNTRCHIRGSASASGDDLGIVAANTTVTLKSYNSASKTGTVDMSFWWNRYDVNFIDETGATVRTQRVQYGNTASAPSMSSVKAADTLKHYVGGHWNGSTTSKITWNKTFTYSYASSLNHSYNDSVVTAATCTTNGTIRHTCPTCSYSYDETVTGKHEYNYTAGPQKVFSSNESVVTTGYTCTRCGATCACKAIPNVSEDPETGKTITNYTWVAVDDTDYSGETGTTVPTNGISSIDVTCKGAGVRPPVTSGSEVVTKSGLRFKCEFDLSTLPVGAEVVDYGMLYTIMPYAVKDGYDANSFMTTTFGGATGSIPPYVDSSKLTFEAADVEDSGIQLVGISHRSRAGFAPVTYLSVYNASGEIMGDDINAVNSLAARKLAFNLVITGMADNVATAPLTKLQNTRIARGFITYKYYGQEFTIYDDVITARSLEYIARAVVANSGSEKPAAVSFAQSIINRIDG